MRNGYGNRRFCSLSERTPDAEFATKVVNAFPNALKSEMALQDAGDIVGIESASVVGDGAEEFRLVNCSRNLDGTGVVVSNGVDDEFSDVERASCLVRRWQVKMRRRKSLVPIRSRLQRGLLGKLKKATGEG